MKYGSVYLVVKDFDKAVFFYEKILDMNVSRTNGKRFAIFNMDGLNLCIMNGRFDSKNSAEIKRIGEYYGRYDDTNAIAENENSRKVFINLNVNNLQDEYERISSLGIATELTPIRFIEYVSPYWYFTFMDPDGNPIEVTGEYKKG